MRDREMINSSSAGIDGRLIFRVGIALTLVGLFLLFRYSIEWFGPLARIGLGATASAGLVVVGILVPRPSYGRLMQGAGVAGAYITAWAAHARYDLVDATTAFMQMFLVVTVGLALAGRERSDVLSAVGMVGAVAAPLLVGGDFVVPEGEVLYQGALLIVAAVLFGRLGWWATLSVTVAGSGLVLLYMLEDPPTSVLAGVALWWLVGWALPVLGSRLGLAPPAGDLTTLATVPVPAIAWLMVYAADGRPAVAALVAALAAATHSAAWLMERTEARSVVHLLVGTGYTALALGVWFALDVAVPLYLLVTASVAVYGSRVGNRPTTALGAFLGALALPVWAALVTGRSTFSVAAVGDLAAVGIVGAAAFVSNGRFQKGVALTAYTMSLVWIAGHLGHLDPGFVTAGFAVVGLTVLVLGRVKRLSYLTLLGLGTLALAVGKLVLVDLASADPPLKIALSLGIGIALLGVGYWVGDTSLVPGAEPARKDG